ncbi:MAG: hypothetical protein IH796_11890, partial [Deltaproteobacteria bacterium]|nr:hypothetical protein [Deltaproteobacteria bacterium]
KAIREVEDYLFPKMGLSHREKSLYYHLLLHTRFASKDTDLFALPQLSSALGIAERSIREALRILDDKGCIRIEEISRRGHLVHAFLPAEIVGLIPGSETTQPIDLESNNLYPKPPSPEPPIWGVVGKIKKAIHRHSEQPNSEQTNLGALFAHEAGHCFYCLKKLPQGTYDSNGDTENQVEACEECNAQKQTTSSEDHLRQLYRRGFLSATELEERLQALGQLQTAKGRS